MPIVYSSFGFAFDTNVYSSFTREHWHNQRTLLQFLFDTNYLSLFPYFSFILIILMYFLANIHFLRGTFHRIIIFFSFLLFLFPPFRIFLPFVLETLSLTSDTLPPAGSAGPYVMPLYTRLLSLAKSFKFQRYNSSIRPLSVLISF